MTRLLLTVRYLRDTGPDREFPACDTGIRQFDVGGLKDSVAKMSWEQQGNLPTVLDCQRWRATYMGKWNRYNYQVDDLLRREELFVVVGWTVEPLEAAE